MTSLHRAAQLGDHVRVAELVLLPSTDVNAMHPKWDTPLHCAAAHGRLAVAEVLLDHGADPNWSTFQGSTPLHFACSLPSRRVAALLLDRGADVNARAMRLGGETPLHVALRRKYYVMATFLLDHGARPDLVGNDSATVLHCALLNGYPHAAYLLEDDRVRAQVRDGVVDASGRGLLHAACRGAGVDVVRRLLDLGADVNARDGLQRVPLHVAVCGSDMHMILELLERGASLSAVDRHNKSALHAAAEHCRDPDVLSTLLQRGADINSTCSQGRTPLDYAVAKFRVPIVQRLLEHGAAVDTSDATQRTPLLSLLFWTKFSGSTHAPRIAQLLLDYGADRNASDANGATARELAAAASATRAAALLLVLDRYFPIKRQMTQLVLGMRGPTPSALTRLAAHPLFDRSVLTLVAGIATGVLSPALQQLDAEASGLPG